MKNIPFAHLHIHSIYSIGDSNIKLKPLFERLDELDMHGVVITDHGNTFHQAEVETIKYNYKTKYVPGCELYFTPGDREAKDNDDRYHLNIMPTNQEGYHNFMSICSDAGLKKKRLTRSAKEYERTDFETLQRYGKGVIGYSACLGGYIPKLLMAGEHEKAKDAVYKFKEVFDEFYLELQAHEHPEQILLNCMIVKLAKETKTGLIITADSHYVLKSDKKYHDILVQIDHRKPYDIDSVYIQSKEEIYNYCIKYDIPLSAMENTAKIIDLVEPISIVQSDKEFFLPHYETPKGYTEATYLSKVTKEGIIDKIPKKKIKNPDKYLKQADYELNQNIIPKGFSGYFLILRDLFQEAKKRKIIMGKGRG